MPDVLDPPRTNVGKLRLRKEVVALLDDNRPMATISSWSGECYYTHCTIGCPSQYHTRAGCCTMGAMYPNSPVAEATTCG